MAEGLSKGDRVKWRSGRGSASGTVERVITSRAKVGGRTVSGSKQDPRYVVKNAETGKTTVLKRGSVSKAAGRSPARKAAAPKDRAAAPAEAAPKAPQPLRRPPRWPRWAAGAGLLAAAAVVAAIVLINDDDDDDGDTDDEPIPVATATQPTTAEDSAAVDQAVQAALGAEPLALAGIETIPRQRIGDDQERLKPQFDSTYQGALADLEELESATAEGASPDTERLAAVTAYLQQQVEIDRAITNAFVRDSFNDGDSAGVLGEKTARTQSTLQKQVRNANQLEAPSEAADVEAAFAAARKANLTYLGDVATAVETRNQAALDQALRDGRAAAARTGRRIATAATALQEEMEGSFDAG